VPEHRTRALVLRTVDQGESDRRLHLYTERLGRVSALAKGARRSRRRFPGALELFSTLDLVLVESPRTSLLRVDSATLERAFEGLAADVGRYAIACEFVEILDRAGAERESHPELFRFALGVLDVLDSARPDRLLALLVQAKTFARLGFRPQLGSCAACGEPLAADGGRAGFSVRAGGAVCAACAAPDDDSVSPELMRALDLGLRTPLRDRAALGLTARGIQRAEELLDRFFRFHVGLELRSSEIVRGLVSLDARDPRLDTAPAPLAGSGVPCEARAASAECAERSA
jgi:DNA repair protein RecO (recombination protein O)